MMVEHDFSIGEHDYVVAFAINDTGDAGFDGPFAIARYTEEGIQPIDYASLTPYEREELRIKLQNYAERDFDCRRYFASEEDDDRRYDERS